MKLGWVTTSQKNSVKSKEKNLGDWYEPKEGIDEIVSTFNNFRIKYGDDWEKIHKAAVDWYNQFPESNPIYSSKHYSWMDDKGVYFPADISGPNYGQYRYDVFHPVTGKKCKEPSSGWRYPENTMIERIKAGFVHFGKDETTVPNNKTYLMETINQSLTSVKYKDGRVASKQLNALMGGNYFTNPKDVSILKSLMSAVKINKDDIVLDFFSGSSSTAQAVMQFNVDSDNKCKFIMVQLQENLDESLAKAKGSSKQVLKNAIDLCDLLGRPHLLTEIGKERIRKAGCKIKDGAGLTAQNLDIGFRVLKVDSTNMKNVYYNPDEYTPTLFDELSDNIKEDRTSLDLLFQVMLEMDVLLSSKITETEICGKKVYSVMDDYLIACFDKGITSEVVEAIAMKEPYYAVFRDNSMADDSTMASFEQVFETYSKDTIRKVL
ncbi:MAG: site-specific DNA-methyltransferase [Firmicutes bacterium]|nr:site-specific DNA-methyltransferase [Bacillota bacterium]